MNRLLAALWLLTLSASACTSTPRTQETDTIEDPHVSGENDLVALTNVRIVPADRSPLANHVLRRLVDSQLLVAHPGLPPAYHGDLPAATYEIIQILPPRAMSDAFTHTIFVDHASGRYWVLRTGGFAGVYELHGPGNIELNDDGEPAD